MSGAGSPMAGLSQECAITTARGRSRRNAANAYLSFALGDELFALPILGVREIIGITDITPVPRLPVHVRGVLNLRGKVVPVIDLRRRLGFPSVADHKRTCIIIVQSDQDNGLQAVQVGVVVDRVREVIDLPPEQVEAPPSLEDHGIDSSCIVGLGKVGKQVVLLLDSARISGVAAAELAAAT